MSQVATTKKPTASSLRDELTRTYGLKLLREDEVRAPLGASTGWSALDSFVASGGFPCGELSLVHSDAGLGGTTIWLQAAARATQQKQRCVWLNGAWSLNPVAADHAGVDLTRLFLIEQPTSSRQRLWVLQEVLSSRLFNLLGCDLSDAHLPLRAARSLLMQARRSGTAVVFFLGQRGVREAVSPHLCSLASLTVHFQNDKVLITRASQRPVPHTLERSRQHVAFISGPLEPSLLFARPRSLPAGTAD